MMGYASNLISITKQSTELGLKADLLTWSLFQDPAVLETLKDTAEQVVFTYPEDPRDLPVKSAFKKKFIDAYGIESGVYAANAYDSYRLLAQAISICASNEDCIKVELSSIKDYEGANGFITVDERGIGQRSEVAMKTVRSAKFVTVTGPSS